MRVSKHPTVVTKAVGLIQFWSCRSFDNETYSSRTAHARSVKTGKGNSSVGLKPCNIRENLWLSNNLCSNDSMVLGKYTNGEITQIFVGFYEH